MHHSDLLVLLNLFNRRCSELSLLAQTDQSDSTSMHRCINALQENITIVGGKGMLLLLKLHLTTISVRKYGQV